MNFKVGDIVITKDKKYGGIVRYIGVLNGTGYHTSIWSSWEEPFDGVIATCMNGGNLSFIDEKYLKLLVKKPVEVFGIVKFMRKINGI